MSSCESSCESSLRGSMSECISDEHLDSQEKTPRFQFVIPCDQHQQTIGNLVDFPGNIWTDDKHCSYLDYIEATFVKNLYQHQYCAEELCGRSTQPTVSSDQPDHPNSPRVGSRISKQLSLPERAPQIQSGNGPQLPTLTETPEVVLVKEKGECFSSQEKEVGTHQQNRLSESVGEVPDIDKESCLQNRRLRSHSDVSASSVLQSSDWQTHVNRRPRLTSTGKGKLNRSECQRRPHHSDFELTSEHNGYECEARTLAYWKSEQLPGQHRCQRRKRRRLQHSSSCNGFKRTEQRRAEIDQVVPSAGEEERKKEDPSSYNSEVPEKKGDPLSSHS